MDKTKTCLMPASFKWETAEVVRYGGMCCSEQVGVNAPGTMTTKRGFSNVLMSIFSGAYEQAPSTAGGRWYNGVDGRVLPVSIAIMNCLLCFGGVL